MKMEIIVKLEDKPNAQSFRFEGTPAEISSLIDEVDNIAMQSVLLTKIWFIKKELI